MGCTGRTLGESITPKGAPNPRVTEKWRWLVQMTIKIRHVAVSLVSLPELQESIREESDRKILPYRASFR